MSRKGAESALGYHLDGCIGQVDELGKNLAVLPSSVELGRVPEGQDGADQLGEALGPCSIEVGIALWETTRQQTEDGQRRAAPERDALMSWSSSLRK